RPVSLVFFFQAEDGIRDFHVTGVQTCALPISLVRVSQSPLPASLADTVAEVAPGTQLLQLTLPEGDALELNQVIALKMLLNAHRSEERRVGKECSAREERRP